jgi:hypothetical protein
LREKHLKESEKRKESNKITKERNRRREREREKHCKKSEWREKKLTFNVKNNTDG